MEFVAIVKYVLISASEPFLRAKIFNPNSDIVKQGLAGCPGGLGLHYSGIFYFFFSFFPFLCSNKYQSMGGTRGWGCGGDQREVDKEEQVDRGDLTGLKCNPSLHC